MKVYLCGLFIFLREVCVANIIVDENIVLKELKMEHSPAIFKLIDSGREYLREWLPFVDATNYVADTEEFVRQSLSKPHIDDEAIKVIYYMNDIAGLISIKNIDRMNHKVEIGYWLGQDFQKRGIMIKSCKRLIKYVFDSKIINRICIKVAENNLRSQKIPVTLGFMFEGIEREGEFYSNTQYFDLKIYSLLKKDYLQCQDDFL